MIGGPGPTPNLLRQHELGKVPEEIAREEREDHDRHGKGRRAEIPKAARRRWFHLLRRT